MLLLANYERYLNAMAHGSIRRQAEDENTFSAEMDDDRSYMTVGSDAIIQVSGPLMYKYDFWCWLMGGCSYTGIRAKLLAAQANSDVRRIVMIVDTPGGEVTGCKETADLIAASSKPIDSIVDPCCASAGLWLISQSRRITCIESGEIGSLGVQAVVRSYHRLMQEAGIDINVIRAKVSPDKNLGHPYEPMSEEATQAIQAKVDKWGEMFLSAVASGRGVSRDTALESFGKGRMLDADEALAVGLIDRIGTIDSVLAEREPEKKRMGSARYNALRISR